MKPLKIKALIIESHPGLLDYMGDIEPIERLSQKQVSVLEAVSDIVVGQMLSRKAARSIIDRAKLIADHKKFDYMACLDEPDLHFCGISRRKAKTIKLFYDSYRKNPEKFEEWWRLGPEALFSEVCSHWGLSRWSASMLAIFYLGMEDVFPLDDGSIKRVSRMLLEKGVTVEPELVKPYRSYLALYLWKILDNNLID